MDPKNTVELKGRNKATIIGADYATTEVDAKFWEEWQAASEEFAPLRSKAIFVAKNAASVAAMGRELAKETTGFEPMKTDGKDKRATGVKKADNE
jgi:hypothetical protein